MRTERLPTHGEFLFGTADFLKKTALFADGALFYWTTMKSRTYCCLAILCLAAIAPQLAHVQAKGENNTLPLKIDDVLVSEKPSGPPPLFGSDAAEAGAQPDFPDNFLKPAAVWPAGVPTSAGLASESAASQHDDAPPPPPIVEVDPLDGKHDFWGSKSHFVQGACGWMRNLWEDQCNFYTWQNAAWIGLGIAVTAPLAETSANQRFRDWYQNRYGNNTQLNNAASYFYNLGLGQYVIPAAVAGGALSLWLEDYWSEADPIAEWFGRTLRAWATGAPTLLIVQFALGEGRPYEYASAYHPLRYDNSASGHAFMGAIPFLTAAEMVDNPLLKGVLVAGSLLTPWCRIQDDAHYLSEVILGYWIAWRAVEAVTRTQQEHKRLWDVFPTATPDGGAQINVLIRY
jgi:hypothetical protein